VKHKTSRRPDPTPASTRRVPALSNAMITKLAAMTRSTMMQTDVAVYQDDLTINITLPDEMDVNGFSSPPMDNSDLSQAIFDAMRWHEPIPDVPPKWRNPLSVYWHRSGTEPQSSVTLRRHSAPIFNAALRNKERRVCIVSTSLGPFSPRYGPSGSVFSA
jgi:hypothetical protein